jgi:hypothetical protein
MKLVAIIVLLALIIIPLIFRILLTLTRTAKLADSTTKSSTILENFKSRKKLYPVIIGLYSLISFGAIFWAVNELGLYQALGLKLRDVIITLTGMVFCFGIITPPIYLYVRRFFKKHPRPTDNNSKEFQEWLNDYSDSILTLRNFGLYLAIIIGGVLVMVIFMIVLVHFIR